MIIRNEEKHWVCIHQDEHARLSAELYNNWGDARIRDKAWAQTLHTAIAEHDRAWIPLDTHPLWNESDGRPFDFTNYPEAEKIEAYRTGIEETELINEKAGLLVSRHLHSFFDSIATAAAEKFQKSEEKRWDRLRGRGETAYEQEALPILKMCDELSLFACMNRPGAVKEDEVPWFRDGFSLSFAFLDHRTVVPAWKNDREIDLTPSPLSAEVRFPLKQRLVLKETVQEKGWLQAYLETPVTTQIVVFRSER
ncbi:DUF3891 family protein [Natribacillus halophilus]|uniref:DUF3891 domain-containing protein n=1 Tax=Natribacillus halophilus TaxID=549003 RepID=A0A1G8J943_9BACI|nr:DUF3891 family protein [Natribacillus halophilus]SDI27755.1 Protein of unknown function [Natribacillus halophilus]